MPASPDRRTTRRSGPAGSSCVSGTESRPEVVVQQDVVVADVLIGIRLADAIAEKEIPLPDIPALEAPLLVVAIRPTRLPRYLCRYGERLSSRPIEIETYLGLDDLPGDSVRCRDRVGEGRRTALGTRDAPPRRVHTAVPVSQLVRVVGATSENEVEIAAPCHGFSGRLIDGLNLARRGFESSDSDHAGTATSHILHRLAVKVCTFAFAEFLQSEPVQLSGRRSCHLARTIGPSVRWKGGYEQRCERQQDCRSCPLRVPHQVRPLSNVRPSNAYRYTYVPSYRTTTVNANVFMDTPAMSMKTGE